MFDVSTIQRILAEWYRMVRRNSQQEVRYRVVIAGDGFSPTRERRSLANALLRAHESLILDANVCTFAFRMRGYELAVGEGLCRLLNVAVGLIAGN